MVMEESADTQRVSTYRIEVTGLDEMIDHFRRVGNPSAATIAKLDSVNTSAFSTTQSRVHRTTGRLLASGSTSSDYDRHTHTVDGYESVR